MCKPNKLFDLEMSDLLIFTQFVIKQYSTIFSDNDISYFIIVPILLKNVCIETYEIFENYDYYFRSY